tara:strand:+ start:190 stop:441 length:252 start_codon:yes stop_codon:yes gene_type:complete
MIYNSGWSNLIPQQPKHTPALAAEAAKLLDPVEAGVKAHKQAEQVEQEIKPKPSRTTADQELMNYRELFLTARYLAPNPPARS